MARTPLFAIVRRALQRAHVANLIGERPATLAALAARTAHRGPSRRQLLGGLALAPLAVACRPLLRAAAQPRIAIVGAGTAGLVCAYRLQQAGLASTVYEASARTGGRMFSARDQLAAGQVIELGGEFIDSDHANMHRLARELALPLDDLLVDSVGLASETFFFDGKQLAIADVVARFAGLAPTMAASAAVMNADARGLAQLDALSIRAWLTQVGRLADDDLLRRLLEVAYETEFGLAADAQSCVNLLAMIDVDQVDRFRIFGDSDERYHVHGGNDAIPAALAARLADQLATRHALTRLAARDAGYDLTFATDSGEIQVQAERVVLALPFTMLRTVDTLDLPLPPAKRQVIAELGYGTNAKLMLQFAQRLWRTQHGAIGSIFCDTPPLQSTWDSSRGQAGEPGILTNFVGGARGLAMGVGSPDERAAEVVPWIDAAYPGAAASYLAGSARRMHWPTQPFTRGSYACYRPGQAQWAGTEGAAVGGVHFAGEHTSVDFQGYMEGAAESGERAAAEVLTALGRVPAR